MKKNHGIPASHFKKSTVQDLNKKGIYLIGMTVIPGFDKNGQVDFSKGETGYEIDDNGCSKIKTFLEVLSLAGRLILSYK